MNKRCPNGTRKNKKTGKCEPKQSKTKKRQPRKTSDTPPKKTSDTPPKKVCPPNKPLYNPRTKRCVMDNEANRKKIEKIQIVDNIRERHEEQKVCPPSKPLYNPKTKRCVINNEANRKKIEKIKHELDKEKEKQLPIAKLDSPPGKKLTEKNKQGPIYDIIKCNFSSFKNIDLNKLSIAFDKKKKKILVFYKKDKTNIELNEKKLIGEGSYGKVYHYFNKKHNLNVALKTFSDPEDYEIEVITAIQRKNIDCNILSCKLLTTPDPYYSASNINTIACELYSSSLDNYELLELLTLKDKILIIKQLANDLLCLEKKKMVYTDLKLENTLFKCLSNTKFKVTLGDIGSICMNENDGVATYVPWENRTNAAKVECSNKQIVWGLGVMLLLMLYFTSRMKRVIHSLFYWENLKDISEKNFKDELLKAILPFREVIVNKEEKLDLSTLLYNMLFMDPTRRISLKQLIKLLENYK